MTTTEKARQRLKRLFNRKPIATLTAIMAALGNKSRSTALRVLMGMGYFTSYNHAGSYYTLQGIPEFDEDGLWSYGDAHFSKHRTLRSTIIELVNKSPAGKTHSELQNKLHLRVHDTLRQLVDENLVGRFQVEENYVYVSANKTSARAQQDNRQQDYESKQEVADMSSTLVVIEVLSAVIHDVKAVADPKNIAKILKQRGFSMTEKSVEEILQRHGVKKTALSRSQRSRL